MSEAPEMEMDRYYTDGELVYEEPAFIVNDDRKAEWCLERIRNAEEDKLKWKKHFDEQYRKIEASANWTIEIMKARLRVYFAQVPHKKAKSSESYPLQTGKLIMKQPEPKYTPDAAALVAFLKDNKLDSFVKTVTTESPNWNDFKKTLKKDDNGKPLLIDTDAGQKLVTEDGTVVEGVKVELRNPEFKVEV